MFKDIQESLERFEKKNPRFQDLRASGIFGHSRWKASLWVNSPLPVWVLFVLHLTVSTLGSGTASVFFISPKPSATPNSLNE